MEDGDLAVGPSTDTGESSYPGGQRPEPGTRVGECAEDAFDVVAFVQFAFARLVQTTAPNVRQVFSPRFPSINPGNN